VKVIDDNLLRQFREKTTCEWCHRYFPQGLDPHHYFFARGTGQHKRLDHRFNLVALDRDCHNKAGAGNISRWQLLEIVAKREGISAVDIEAELWRLRRE
jgi:hypothetical protein